MPAFPIQVWDGSTPNTERVNLRTDQWCNHQDWKRIRDEVIAVQEYVLSLPDSSGHVYVGFTFEAIAKGQVVRVRPDGDIEIADNTEATAAGVALQSASIGEPLTYVTSGKISMPFTLTAGSEYFAIASGGLSETAPTSGYVIRIGQAQTDTLLDVNIQKSIRL